jgi:hypothetical protein
VKPVLAALALFGATALALPVQAQAPAAARTAVDYRADASWLCRPGRQDACSSVDLTTTLVAASGQLTQEPFAANPRAPIDCFYVYPTVSMDPTPNSDMAAGPEERSVVEQQLARFGSKCRIFAPLYRQVTITALRAGMMGQTMPGVDRDLGYGDVKAAWNEYLKRDNKRRGVVLIGHSQGSGVLKRLIAEEIEGKPVQERIVSAMLIGTNVLVPQGQDVGGDFKSMTLCRNALQTGCVISYVTFRWEAPPPPAARFGRTQTAGMQIACTNPAGLALNVAGGSPAPLRAYLPAQPTAASQSSEPPPVWTSTGAVGTKFVALPGLLRGQCVNGENGSYLGVITDGDPADPRTDRIPGDVVIGGNVQTDWGLHLIDMNVAMGDLVDLVGRQAEAYRTKSRSQSRR